jgi:tripartite-type tricarboxylate transporter receptor subunit TctC
MIKPWLFEFFPELGDESRNPAPAEMAASFSASITSTNAILPTLDPKLPYNPARDFAPIIHIANLPNVLVVNSKVEVKSVKELVELARSKPGGLS